MRSSRASRPGITQSSGSVLLAEEVGQGGDDDVAGDEFGLGDVGERGLYVGGDGERLARLVVGPLDEAGADLDEAAAGGVAADVLGEHRRGRGNLDLLDELEQVMPATDLADRPVGRGCGEDGRGVHRLVGQEAAVKDGGEEGVRRVVEVVGGDDGEHPLGNAGLLHERAEHLLLGDDVLDGRGHRHSTFWPMTNSSG
jgi:hypothetical protein